MAEFTLDLFWEEAEGIFYDSPRDGEELVFRPREVMDNATPSGTSLAAELLLRIGHLFGTERDRTIALRALTADLELATGLPSAFGRYLATLARAVEAPVEVVILGDMTREETRSLLASAHASYLPSRVVAGGEGKGLPSLPLLEGRGIRDGGATAYVCRDFSCSAPIQEAEELKVEVESAARRARPAEDSPPDS